MPPGVSQPRNRQTFTYDNVINIARSQLGVPYIAYMMQPGRGFDCSTFTKWIFSQFGYSMVSQSNLQYRLSQKIPIGRGGSAGWLANARPGDLLFFRGARPHPPEMIGHVAIYVGNGMMIEAPGTGGHVQLTRVRSNLMAVGRLPPAQNYHGPPASIVPLPNRTWAGGGVTPDPSVVGSPGSGGATPPPGGPPVVNPQPGGPPAPAPAVGSGTPALPVSNASVEEYIRSHYGYMSSFLNDAEIGPILRQAAKDGLDLQGLYGRLSSTVWWRQHSDTQRQWAALVAEDPATAKRVRDTKAAEISDIAANFGVSLSAEVLREITERSIALGMTDLQTRIAIMDRAQRDNLAYERGQLGANWAEISGMSAQYGVSLTGDTTAGWSRDMALGYKNSEEIRTELTNQAKNIYGNNQAIVTALDNGGTVLDVVGMARDKVASELEMDPSEIDIREARWRPIVSAPVPNTTGEVSPMDELQATKFARAQDEYKTTVGARRKVAVGGQGILRGLGLTA